MKTCIVYLTKHGTSEKAAFMLKGAIGNGCVVLNLKNEKNIALNDYDNVIVGGSIHVGKLNKSLSQFIKENEKVLLSKRLGLFLCCMESEEVAKQEFETAFSEQLRNHASAAEVFGGEFLFEEMNFIEKAIVKKVAGVQETTHRLDHRKIESFAEKFRGE